MPPSGQVLDTNERRRQRFLIDVAEECRKATKEHGAFHSFHEAYAVLLEEVDELWDEVKKKKGQRQMRDMRQELMQIAAMCLKTVETFGL